MKKVFLGIHELGYERVRLYLRGGSGASTEFMPEDKGLPCMEIGADYDKFRKVVASLIHEAQETAMCRLGLSFFPAASLNTSTANCIFSMNHEQFDECCDRAADLVTTAMPVLKREWKAWQLRAKKSKKKR